MEKPRTSDQLPYNEPARALTHYQRQARRRYPRHDFDEDGAHTIRNNAHVVSYLPGGSLVLGHNNNMQLIFEVIVE